ncbi:hypothetical protein HNQ59_003257 [Chitinivorax tropicus]|uniref:Uncharacterized protein n=1 Tax=Chitinivorax tropicus TaxID=714531 RepID=A0A840MS95_9PROT|nr:hypothetical protein [Chitinivorax tropicus]MBB5019949.1 hypothetical protein [Chitinivorax tropicus]
MSFAHLSTQIGAQAHQALPLYGLPEANGRDQVGERISNGAGLIIDAELRW